MLVCACCMRACVPVHACVCMCARGDVLTASTPNSIADPVPAPGFQPALRPSRVGAGGVGRRAEAEGAGPDGGCCRPGAGEGGAPRALLRGSVRQMVGIGYNPCFRDWPIYIPPFTLDLQKKKKPMHSDSLFACGFEPRDRINACPPPKLSTLTCLYQHIPFQPTTAGF